MVDQLKEMLKEKLGKKYCPETFEALQEFLHESKVSKAVIRHRFFKNKKKLDGTIVAMDQTAIDLDVSYRSVHRAVYTSAPSKLE